MASSDSVTLRGALAPVSALLIGTALLYLGFGLQTTLVPLRAEAEGFSRLTVGLLGATYYAGFVMGCLFVPYLIQRAGHIRAFAALVSCVSAAALAFPLLVDEVPWVLARFIIGVCIAGVLVIIESWLNEKASATTRGAVMSAYIMITYAGITIGQLGVTTQPLTDFSLFSLCSILLSIAAVPVALTRTTQPPPIPAVRFRPRRLWGLAPAAFAGAFIAGLMTGSVLSLSAVYAVDTGFSKNEAAIFASAIVLGGALGQYPFGRTSDFVDRRLVLLAGAAATVCISLVLLLASVLTPPVVLALGLGLGFVMLPTYSLAAAHAYDWTEFEDMVETSASMNLLFGVGSTVGPIVSSVMMVAFGASGLFVVVAVAGSALAAFITIRIAARGRPDEAIRSEFDLYATAPVGAVPTEMDVEPVASGAAEMHREGESPATPAQEPITFTAPPVENVHALDDMGRQKEGAA